MRKRTLVAAVVLLAIAAATFQTGAAGQLKIGFVYLGPIGDLGWTYQHEVAAERSSPPLATAASIRSSSRP